MIQSLVVFCGSKSGANPIYEAEAKTLGNWLGVTNKTLIYGGGNKGIMGAVANACLASNGSVIGIIPKLLLEWEAHHTNLPELIVTEDMHERKKLLYEKADAAVVLPGGYGTLDELFEMLTWNQLSIHNKKIFILNSGGFYNHLIAHARMMYEQDFLYDKIEERFQVVNTVEELIAMLKT